MIGRSILEGFKKKFEKAMPPPPAPMRICIAITDSLVKGAPASKYLYWENPPARNQRYFQRFQRGFITETEYETLAASPLASGYFEIPETDFPLPDDNEVNIL